MAVYRSARGKMIDMGAMMVQNEKVRAVGNGKMNARGDTIDAHGRVIVPATQKVSEAYAKTVSNPGAQTRALEAKPEPIISKELPAIELSDFEKQLNEEMENDAEVENIKKEEVKTRSKK